MLPAPPVRSMVNRNGCSMPGVPAVPRNNAYSDHANAASVPMEISVSMVAAPWRGLSHAARWNGSAPHTTTGAASARHAHCQYSNCSHDDIDIATTGTDSTRLTSSRVRSAASSRASGLGARQLGGVPHLLDDTDQHVGAHRLRRGHERLLDRVVDAGLDAVQPVQLLLDASGARRTGHATDRE